MVRALAALFIMIATLVAGAVPALASCAPPRPTAEAAAAADIVAYGDVPDDLQRATYGREITFRVRSVLKGTLPSVVRVRVGPEIPSAGPFTLGGTSVDWRPAPGDQVVYLRIRNGYETDACAANHPGAPTADERRVLGAGTAPGPASIADEFAALGVYPFVAIGLAFVAGGAVLLARLRRRGGRRA
jgi:hypothetical protein